MDGDASRCGCRFDASDPTAYEVWIDDVTVHVEERFGSDDGDRVRYALELWDRLRIELPSLERYMEEFELDYDEAIVALVEAGLEAS